MEDACQASGQSTQLIGFVAPPSTDDAIAVPFLTTSGPFDVVAHLALRQPTST